jgi:hypothetical protein
VVRAQVVLALAMMTANLGLSIGFTYWVGLSGVIWGSIAAQLGVVVTVLIAVLPRALNRLQEMPTETSST